MCSGRGSRLLHFLCRTYTALNYENSAYVGIYIYIYMCVCVCVVCKFVCVHTHVEQVTICFEICYYSISSLAGIFSRQTGGKYIVHILGRYRFLPDPFQYIVHLVLTFNRTSSAIRCVTTGFCRMNLLHGICWLVG
jgi:hypothetical protein